MGDTGHKVNLPLQCGIDQSLKDLKLQFTEQDIRNNVAEIFLLPGMRPWCNFPIQ